VKNANASVGAGSRRAARPAHLRVRPAGRRRHVIDDGDGERELRVGLETLRVGGAQGGERVEHVRQIIAGREQLEKFVGELAVGEQPRRERPADVRRERRGGGR